MTDREIFNLVVQWFREDDWNCDVDEDQLVLRTGINGENGKYRVFAHVQNENVVLHSISPTDVPTSKRNAIAEYLTRANYGLVIGNFEMDYSDGEVRFKTSIKVKDGAIAPWMINNLAYINCAMIDKYYPGLMNVLYGGATPEKAVQKVEQ